MAARHGGSRMDKQKKSKVNIFLIKEDRTKIKSIIAVSKTDLNRYDLKQYGTLFIRRSPDLAPSWVSVFFDGCLDSSLWTSSSISAVLVVSVEVTPGLTRLFALTFGYGRSLIEPDAIERRFGLKCVLNSIDSNSLRQVNKTLVSGNARRSIEQMPRRSSIAEFSLDYEQDLLNGVTAVAGKECVLEGTLVGSDSLSVSLRADYRNTSQYLKQVFEVYQTDGYKEHFPWIDHVSLVKDPELVTQLEQLAVSSLCARNQSIWFAVPEVLKWEEIAGFSYSRQGDVFDDILVEDLLASMGSALEQFSQLKTKDIYAISSIDESVRHRWKANRCLYGELELNDNQYCITDGQWYQIEKSYAQQVKREYESTSLSKICFPDYHKGCDGEAEYNSTFAESSESYLLMDARTVQFGGGHSSIELCDVLSADGQYIHIKRYAGSSVMSHLFNQGLVSMDLIKTDQSFIEKANLKISEYDKTGSFIIKEDSVKEVVYGIVSKRAGSLPQIPFFSKVTFLHVKKRLHAMGVKVSLAAIYEVE